MAKTTKTIVKEITKSQQKVVGHKFYQTTGSTLINMCVSAGEDLGLPFGSIVNITGKKGSGKTFLAVEGIGASMAQYKGRIKHKYDDTEGGNRFNTKALYGYDLDRINTKTFERMSYQINKEMDSLKEKELLVYVNDSWDANSTDAEQKNLEKAIKNFKKTDTSDRDDTFGGAARAMAGSTFFRDNIDKIEKSQTLMIIMSQVRLQMAGAFSYDGKSGGNALDHYCDTIIKVKKVSDIIQEGLQVGSILKIDCPKNRTPRPFRSCYVRIYFKMGIDEVGSNLIYLYDMLTAKGEFKKSDVSPTKVMIPKVDWIDDHKPKEGKKPDIEDYWTLDEACTYIESNDLEPLLKRRIMQKWNDREDKAEENIVARKKKYVL